MVSEKVRGPEEQGLGSSKPKVVAAPPCLVFRQQHCADQPVKSTYLFAETMGFGLIGACQKSPLRRLSVTATGCCALPRCRITTGPPTVCRSRIAAGSPGL